jgi:hypothetical protein
MDEEETPNMNNFHRFRENAENCAQLAEAATDETEAKRYRRMAEAWLALANEQDWLEGEVTPDRSAEQLDA